MSTQSGLFFRGPSGPASDTPKPSTQAFRFPFVALRQTRRQVRYWGRTPTSAAATVIVERSAGRVETSGPRPDGIGRDLHRHFVSTRRTGSLRARIARRARRSVPFSLLVPPDRDVCPFGSC